MIESDHSKISGSPLNQAADFSAAIASLRLAGAEKFDPVGLHYIEALAKRIHAHQKSVKLLLERKLTQTLVDFKRRLEQAQSNAKDCIDPLASQYPQDAADLHRLFSAGDFRGLSRFIATLKPSEDRASLGDLARQMEQNLPKNASNRFDGRFNADIRSRSEQKTVQYFRNTWSKLSVDKRVTQALAQAPMNPGPMNSHMLVLRSLALMRDNSPDYLHRFSAYVDTLLCLDQCDAKKQSNPKKPQMAVATKKKKSSRSIQKLP